MQLSFEHFKIELLNDQSYDVNSSDNLNSYLLEHFAEEQTNCTNGHGIKVSGAEKEFSAIVLANGGGTGIHPKCATINTDELLICCGDHVFCLTLPTLELKWKTKADTATVFEVRPIENGYIVHGELEISRIDKSGKIVWQQSGADIFVTPDGDGDFKITSENIQVNDWNNTKYTFDHNGAELNN